MSGLSSMIETNGLVRVGGRRDALAIEGIPASLKIAAGFVSKLPRGSLEIGLPDGRTLRFTGTEEGPQARIQVVDPTFARNVLAKGDIGFAEAYMDGRVDTDDMTSVLEYFSANFDDAGPLAVGGALAQSVNNLRHALRPNSKRGAKRNILAHYDLGNAFYSAWLDPTMTYSSAKFEDPRQPLQDAQLVKYRAVARSLGLGPDTKVLEIGSGWGGFAEVAAKEFGARVTSLTISDAQHEFARRRMFEAGLADKVDIQLRDYRDVAGRYDAIASIEMFEAVGEQYWPAYFDKVANSLESGGRAVLQVITIANDQFENYRRRADFIKRYIFPGGMLPSVDVMKRETEKAGLQFSVASTFGQSYARTLAEWAKRFTSAWDEIKLMGFDERFRRLWLYYLAYCEAGFKTRRIDVGHFVLAKA